MLKKTFSLMGATIVLVNFMLNAQTCESGFSYYENIPANVNNINNDDKCFSDADIAFLSECRTINNLNYNSPLDMGPQTWATGRLKVWVATYIPSGSNGLTQKMTQLPDNIGNITEITTLYLEKHDLTSLPNNITLLSNLSNFFVSNNWLAFLPENFGNLTAIVTLDLGYNKLESVPASIGNLINIEYLFLFNNQLSTLPDTICNLDLDWDGISSGNYPYFACGGNIMCNTSLIPECVENSSNFEISMEQNYYSFLLDAPQDCPECPSLGDLNGDGGYNVLDIVSLANCVLANNCTDLDNGCAGDMNGDGGFNVLDIVSLANCVLANNCGN
tara:strand:- start:681 stop:1673 length:993 start_codon:yes stop_codon:yes gene_type:complete